MTERSKAVAATLLVFESMRRPYRTRVVYACQAGRYIGPAGWKHTATLEPAVWIEWLLNHPEDRHRHIEGLMAMRTMVSAAAARE